MATKRKHKKRKKSVNSILLILIVFGVGCFVYGLYLNTSTTSPDYATFEIDENAIKEDDDQKKMEISKNGGGVSLSFSNQVVIKDNKADFYFKNPGRSRADVTIQLVLIDDNQEKVIAKSKLIPVGYAIRKLKVDKNLNLNKKEYDGKFRLTYYDEKTKEKTLVNSELDVKINIK